MHTYLVVGLRVIEAASALPCFYIAWLLYEDQEQRVQDKLAEVWVRIQDDRSTPSYINRYIRACADLTDQALTRIFGAQLISLRSVGISLSYAVASYLLVMFFPGKGAGTIAWMAGCFVSGTLAAAFPNRYSPLLALVVPIAFLTQRINAASSLPVDYQHLFVSSGSFVVGILAAAALDFWWIGLNRKLIKWALERHWLIPMVTALLTGAAILVSAFLPFTRDPFSDSLDGSNLLYNLALCVAIILSTRLFSAVVAGVFFLSMILVLLYWCFGSLIARLVYAAERHSIIRAHKTFALIGAALLRTSVTDSGSLQWVSEAIKFVAKIAGG